MNAPAYSVPARIPTTRSAWTRLTDWLRERALAFKQSRRLAQEDALFRALDGATLRDLGVSHSEAGSFWAESTRQAQATRLRVLRELQSGTQR